MNTHHLRAVNMIKLSSSRMLEDGKWSKYWFNFNNRTFFNPKSSETELLWWFLPSGHIQLRECQLWRQKEEQRLLNSQVLDQMTWEMWMRGRASKVLFWVPLRTRAAVFGGGRQKGHRVTPLHKKLQSQSSLQQKMTPRFRRMSLSGENWKWQLKWFLLKAEIRLNKWHQLMSYGQKKAESWKALSVQSERNCDCKKWAVISTCIQLS